MKTFLILICLLQLSLQVEHCLIPKQVCTACSDGYYLVNGKCVTLANCIEISPLDQCFKCLYGYRLDFDTYKCVEIGKDNCYQYSITTPGVCDKCRPGYKKKSDNTCELVTEHCTEEDNEICRACDKGFALTHDNLCVKDENCKELDNEKKCEECDEDKSEFLFINKEGQCVLSSCETFQLGKCRYCKNYFYMKDNECFYTDIPYCEAPRGDNCDNWADFVNDPTNIEQDIKNHKEKCQYRDKEGTCQNCFGGYTYDKSKKKCILNNCKEFDENSECEYCENGYLLINYQTECIKADSLGSKNADSTGGNNNEGINNAKFNAFNLILLILILFY